jgi:peptidoglycan/LPS O-acetylase OafA/YrhL
MTDSDPDRIRIIHSPDPDPRRLEVLLLVLALGVIAMTLLGLSLEQQQLHRHYQANTIRTRRILSFFVLGTLAAATNAHPPTPAQLSTALAAARTAAIL